MIYHFFFALSLFSLLIMILIYPFQKYVCVCVCVCILELIFLALNEELYLNLLRIQELRKSYSCLLAQDMSHFSEFTHYRSILLEWRFWVRPGLMFFVSKKKKATCELPVLVKKANLFHYG